MALFTGFAKPHRCRAPNGFNGLSKSFSQKRGGSGVIDHMNSVLEIEMALRQLPPQERWEIARWLLEDLQESNLSNAEGKGSGENGGRTPQPPDYSARRRRIFGSKVLPHTGRSARCRRQADGCNGVLHL
jgi:hypothetical protein